MAEYNLNTERLHFAWDNSLAPALEIEPGGVVTIETWDASGHF
jgi:acetamidase/formamidase